VIIVSMKTKVPQHYLKRLHKKFNGCIHNVENMVCESLIQIGTKHHKKGSIYVKVSGANKFPDILYVP